MIQRMSLESLSKGGWFCSAGLFVLYLTLVQERYIYSLVHK